MRREGLIFALLMLGAVARADSVTVHVTGIVPIEKLDAGGQVTGVTMSTPGTTFTLVRAQGDQIEVRDVNSQCYLIRPSGTDYALPPAPVVVAAPAPVAAASSTHPPAAVDPVTNTNAVPVVTSAFNPDDPLAPHGSAPSGDAQTMAALNEAFGFALFSADPFWTSPIEAVAGRLGWPRESATTTQVSYRRYSDGVRVLGSAAYSLALYGREDKATYLSIVFANAGDFAEAAPLQKELQPDPGEVEKVRKDLAVQVKAASDVIESKLSLILGPPSHSLFGNSASNREDVHRWDWNGASFLFNTHNGEYATLKIIPVEAADHYGTIEIADDDTMRDTLAKRVIRRPNGDVVLSDVPMVDQGPKGYCVPATWERYLRYMDIPADLYVLAMMGGTGLGGGTSPELIRARVDDYVSAYHRRIEVIDDPADVTHVAKYIDQGLPLMWDCWVTQLTEAEVSLHTHDRMNVSDWPAYVAQVAKDDQARELKESNANQGINGHERMIIGYNEASHELAISDSWGDFAAERWISEKEANDISQGQLCYIRW